MSKPSPLREKSPRAINESAISPEPIPNWDLNDCLSKSSGRENLTISTGFGIVIILSATLGYSLHSSLPKPSEGTVIFFALLNANSSKNIYLSY